MPAVTTEGIILKRKEFGEADRVLTVLTKGLGKISVIARGVRKITSRRAGNVEVLNRVKLHLFKAKNYTLSEAESIETFAVLKENLILATTAFHIVEIVDRLTVENVKNENLYELTVGLLQILEKNPRQIFVRAFEIKVLSILGFWSVKAIDNLTEPMQVLLFKLEYNSWKEIGEQRIERSEAGALEKMLRLYLEKILEAKLKSSEVMRKLKI